jgi:hypothetical protein
MALRQVIFGLCWQIHSVRGTRQCSQRLTLVPLALKGRVALASSCALRASTELAFNHVNCEKVSMMNFTMKTGSNVNFIYSSVFMTISSLNSGYPTIAIAV